MEFFMCLIFALAVELLNPAITVGSLGLFGRLAI